MKAASDVAIISEMPFKKKAADNAKRKLPKCKGLRVREYGP
jgi:hypothetical protein